MKPIFKITIALVFLCAAPFTFAEQYYGAGAGVHFISDHFPLNTYSRGLYSTNILFSFLYFPQEKPFGLFTQASFGLTGRLMENNGRESMRVRKSDIFEIRLAAAPSYRIKAGNKADFPISLGPAFIYTNEDASERLLTSHGAVPTKYNYQSMSLGLKADAGFLLTPSAHFFMKPGLALDFFFLRSEQGEMRMNYRTTHNDIYKIAKNYYSFNLSFYFLMGLHR